VRFGFCWSAQVAAVHDLGWQLPTDVQAEAIPLILGGGDLLCAAETGSGKTGAFSLPVLQIVHEHLRQQAIRSGAGGTAGTEDGERAAARLSLSLEDRDGSMAIDSTGLCCQCRLEGGQAWAGCRARVGQLGGRYGWEARARDDGLCRVGFSARSASLELGIDRLSFGYGGTGKKSSGRQFEAYGEPYMKDDVIGCYLGKCYV
jgi:ATP-dependent RNA helicase DDX1